MAVSVVTQYSTAPYVVVDSHVGGVGVAVGVGAGELVGDGTGVGELVGDGAGVGELVGDGAGGVGVAVAVGLGLARGRADPGELVITAAERMTKQATVPAAIRLRMLVTRCLMGLLLFTAVWAVPFMASPIVRTASTLDVVLPPSAGVWVAASLKSWITRPRGGTGVEAVVGAGGTCRKSLLHPGYAGCIQVLGIVRSQPAPAGPDAQRRGPS
jgi:hypothetical protein